MPRFVLILLLLCLSFGSLARAQDSQTNGTEVRAWAKELETLADQIERKVPRDEGTSLERKRIRTLITLAVARREVSLERAKQVQQLLDQLGPKPEADAAPEEPVIAKRRADLTAELSRYETESKQSALIIAQGEQILLDLSRTERAELRDTLLQRGPTPVHWEVWVTAGQEFAGLFVATFLDAPRDWWAELQRDNKKRSRALQVLLYAFLATLVGWPLRRWLTRRFGRDPSLAEPSASRRLLAALSEGLTGGLIPVVFLAAIGVLVVEGGLVEDALASAVGSVVRGIIIFLLSASLLDAALAPEALQWRLMALPDAAARLLVNRAKLSLVLFLFPDALYRALSWTTPSESFQAVFATLTTLILAPALIATLSRRIWGKAIESPTDADPDAEASAGPLRTRLRSLLSLALLLTPILALVGYGQLANYMMRLLVLSTIIISLLWFLRTMLREAVTLLLEGEGRLGKGLRDALAITQLGAKRLKALLFLASDMGLIVFGLTLLLPVWGLRPAQMMDLASSLFNGFRVGSYTFSLADLLLGIMLFTTIILITRVIQKSVTQHLLPSLTQDKGISDALKSGIGYLGVLIAALAAISAMGIDLTNLALIAGALSVGIGFGLQTIVNNFVSGLILLAERPIKPGDWVVIGEHEGTVKKVNVRSTEITTFQRASVIIPNADLISSSVLNWTHKNLLGRVDILIGVAYGSDVQKVKEILLESAKEQANVLTYPLPMVVFKDFGDSALMFELRAFLRNVELRVTTASDIRFAILAKLTDAGIEIPFPQRVVHMSPPPQERLGS
ncbi:mechanosensitive ion channel [Magnetospira thiophila]